MNTRFLRTSFLIVGVALLGACAHRQAPVYEEQPTLAGQRAPIQYGVVRSIDSVSSRESTTGGGALAGAVVGAVIGRQFGSSGSGRTMGTILGAVGGAVAGNEIEHQQTQPSGRFRIQVQLDDGQTRVFNVAQPGDLHVGDRVAVEGNNLRRY